MERQSHLARRETSVDKEARRGGDLSNSGLRRASTRDLTAQLRFRVPAAVRAGALEASTRQHSFRAPPAVGAGVLEAWTFQRELMRRVRIPRLRALPPRVFTAIASR